MSSAISAVAGVLQTDTASIAGSYDHFLNFQIGFVIILQIAMCIFCAVASYIWRNQLGLNRYHLAMDSYTQASNLIFEDLSLLTSGQIQFWRDCT